MASLRFGAPALTQAQSSSSGISGTPCKLLSKGARGGRNNAESGAAAARGVAHHRSHQQRRRVDRVMAQQAEQESGGGGDGDGDEDFDARLARLQRKVTSGSGKKAELRKARKDGGDYSPASGAGAGSGSKDGIFIAPVALQEPVSDGLPVAPGFSFYTERLHGRLAALGLAAVLLVELATGDSLVKFHDSGTLTLQVPERKAIMSCRERLSNFRSEQKTVLDAVLKELTM